MKKNRTVRFPDMSKVSVELIKKGKTDIEVRWTTSGGLPQHMWLPISFLV
jgi:hypothetical protein